MTRSPLLDFGLRVAAVVYLFFQFVVVGVALIPAVLFVKMFWDRGSLVLLALAFAVAYLLFGLTFLLLVILARYVTFFRSREGDYPFVSLYAIRWAFVGSLASLAKILILGHLKGMPILNGFYRAMGARIGKDVLINTCNMFDFDLLEIGDGTFIGGDAVVIGHLGEDGLLKIRRVRIGKGCVVGQSSVVFPGATMEDGSTLGALSLLPKGKTLPPGTVWGGNPLREIRRGGAEAEAGDPGPAVPDPPAMPRL
jgi:non-ribosomal peptide synthetase-like protein